jgi:hypothetical protein
MPSNERRTGTRAAVARRPDGHAAEARSGDAREGAITARGAGRDTVRRPEAALGGLLRGLRAGDLECVLLTVAMAADENRMPSADPEEAERILAFLARLAEHDAALPPSAPPRRPSPDGPGAGSGWPVDGGAAGDGAPDPG